MHTQKSPRRLSPEGRFFWETRPEPQSQRELRRPCSIGISSLRVGAGETPEQMAHEEAPSTDTVARGLLRVTLSPG